MRITNLTAVRVKYMIVKAGDEKREPLVEDILPPNGGAKHDLSKHGNQFVLLTGDPGLSTMTYFPEYQTYSNDSEIAVKDLAVRWTLDRD
jgi:hypothetical protein